MSSQSNAKSSQGGNGGVSWLPDWLPMWGFVTGIVLIGVLVITGIGYLINRLCQRRETEQNLDAYRRSFRRSVLSQCNPYAANNQPTPYHEESVGSGLPFTSRPSQATLRRINSGRFSISGSTDNVCMLQNHQRQPSFGGNSFRQQQQEQLGFGGRGGMR